MIKKLQALRAKKGFTLVELIVVIAIIGVLAAILVPTMMGFVTSSRVTSANSTAASFEDQIETFLTEADTAGYGMKLSDTSTCIFTISVDSATGSPVWTIGFAANDSQNVNSFKSSSTTSWTASATVSSGDTKVSKSDDATALLGLSLMALFPASQQLMLRLIFRAATYSMYSTPLMIPQLQTSHRCRFPTIQTAFSRLLVT